MPSILIKVAEILSVTFLKEFVRKQARNARRKWHKHKSAVPLTKEDLDEIEEVERILDEEAKKSHAE